MKTNCYNLNKHVARRREITRLLYLNSLVHASDYAIKGCLGSLSRRQSNSVKAWCLNQSTSVANCVYKWSYLLNLQGKPEPFFSEPQLVYVC